MNKGKAISMLEKLKLEKSLVHLMPAICTVEATVLIYRAFCGNVMLSFLSDRMNALKVGSFTQMTRRSLICIPQKS